MSSNSTHAQQPTTSNHASNERTSLHHSIQNSCGKVERCVRDNPASAMLVSLGVGLGVGVAAGMIFGGSKDTSRRWIDPRTPERLGRQIMDTIAKVVPDSISDRISS